MVIVEILVWISLGMLLSIYEQMFCMKDQWTGEIRVGDMLRRSKYGFFVLLDIVGHEVDRDGATPRKSNRDKINDVIAEMNDEMRELDDELVATHDDEYVTNGSPVSSKCCCVV